MLDQIAGKDDIELPGDIERFGAGLEIALRWRHPRGIEIEVEAIGFVSGLLDEIVDPVRISDADALAPETDVQNVIGGLDHRSDQLALILICDPMHHIVHDAANSRIFS